MRILWINNDGAGFADYLNVPEEITVQKLFDQQMAGARPGDYLIRVNRQPVAADQVLHENDRVSFTPVKIEGAVLASRQSWATRRRFGRLLRFRCQPDVHWQEELHGDFTQV